MTLVGVRKKVAPAKREPIGCIPVRRAIKMIIGIGTGIALPIVLPVGPCVRHSYEASFGEATLHRPDNAGIVCTSAIRGVGNRTKALVQPGLYSRAGTCRSIHGAQRVLDQITVEDVDIYTV